MTIVKGSNVEGIYSATLLGISGLSLVVVSLDKLSKIVLAVALVVKWFLEQHLSRTEIVGDAIWIGEVICLPSHLHD